MLGLVVVLRPAAADNLPKLDKDLSTPIAFVGWEKEIEGYFSDLDRASRTTQLAGLNVVLTFATKETEFLTYNLLSSARRVGLEEIIVAYFGEVLPDFCHKQPIPQCLLIPVEIPVEEEVSNRRVKSDSFYKALMVTKQLSVWFLLQKGFHVLSLDNDVVLRKNLLVYLSSLHDFDLIAQGIDCHRKSWDCFGLNGGLFYARASNVTIKLFNRSIVEYKGNVSHQEALNIAAKRIATEEKLKIWRLEHDRCPYLEDLVKACGGSFNHQDIVALHLTGHTCSLGRHLKSIRDKFTLLRRHGFLDKEALKYYSLHKVGFNFPVTESFSTNMVSSRSKRFWDNVSSCSLLFASFFIVNAAGGYDDAISLLMIALNSVKRYHPSACVGILTKDSSLLNELIEPSILIFEVLPADEEEIGREFFKSVSMPRYRAIALLLSFLPPWVSVVLMDGDILVTGSFENLFTQNFHVGLTLMRVPSMSAVEKHYREGRRHRRSGEVFSGGMFFIPSYGKEHAQIFFHELVLSAEELSPGEAEHLPDQAIIYHLFRQQGRIAQLQAAVEGSGSHTCLQLLLQGVIVHFAILGWEFNAPFGLHCSDDRALHFKGLNSNWHESKENPKRTMLLLHNDSGILSRGECQRVGYVLLDGKPERRIFSKFEEDTQVLCTSTRAVDTTLQGRNLRHGFREVERATPGRKRKHTRKRATRRVPKTLSRQSSNHAVDSGATRA